MKKMILLFSHKLTGEQKKDAKMSFFVDKFVELPQDLQKIWSNVPPNLEDLSDHLKPIRDFLISETEPNDILLVSGDFGAVHRIAIFANAINCKPVYATTKREVIEKNINGKIVKTSVFEHIRFREF